MAQFTKDEREFLTEEVKKGKNYTTPIHPIGEVGYQAIKKERPSWKRKSV